MSAEQPIPGESETGATGRGVRADAVRNGARILEAARRRIAEQGPDVPMSQIAKDAGVAVGTLYRHYPTKTDLVHAILSEHSEAILIETEAAARAVAAPGDAFAGLERLLRGLLVSAAKDRAFKAAAASLGAARSTPEQDQRGHAALATLVRAAQADGDVRPGVSSDDIYLIILSAPTNLPDQALRRWLDLFLAGIGTRQDTLRAEEKDVTG